MTVASKTALLALAQKHLDAIAVLREQMGETMEKIENGPEGDDGIDEELTIMLRVLDDAQADLGRILAKIEK